MERFHSKEAALPENTTVEGKGRGARGLGGGVGGGRRKEVWD